MKNVEASGGGGAPIFHIGCGTLLIAAVVGMPLAGWIADAAFGENYQVVGGTIGFFVAMLALGFLARLRQKGFVLRGARRRRAERPAANPGKLTGLEAIRAEMEREFLVLMKSELDEMQLGQVRRDRMARQLVASLEGNAADKSRDALIIALRGQVLIEKEEYRKAKQAFDV